MPNISQSKGNHATKFSHLIEYNMRNIFLEASYTKCSMKLFLSLWSKKSKMSISLDQQSEILYSFFYCMDYQNTLKLTCWLLAFTSNKVFLKNKKRSATSLSASFSGWFFKKKYFSRHILLTNQNSLADCLYFLKYCAISIM